MNKFSRLCALCATLLVSIVTFADDGATITATYAFPEWNEYPVQFDVIAGDWASRGQTINCYNIASGETVILRTTVEVDDDATLCFEGVTNYQFTMEVSLDGNVVDTYTHWEFNGEMRRHFVEMSAGVHNVSWTITNVDDNYGSAAIENIGVRKTPTVNVNLLEPGSLGTEILYNVERLQDVRKLKIKGEMNSDDWAKIDMIKGDLFMLDLGEAKITTISEKRFNDLDWLHTVVLPEGLEVICMNAFSFTPLANVNFPATLTTIEYNAFHNTCIKEVTLPAGCNLTKEERGAGCQFSYCKSLKTVTLPEGLTLLPAHLFEGCDQLEMEIPEGITMIEKNVFKGCWLMNVRMPQSLTYIGEEAFYGCSGGGYEDGVVSIPDKVTYIGREAFKNTGYTKAEVSMSYCVLEAYSYNFLPDNIKVVKLKSPTMVKRKYGNSIVPDDKRAGITLQVPVFLLSSYKLDSYWYNFGKIEGYDPGDVHEWVIGDDLLLDQHYRFSGQPNMTIKETASLKIVGNEAQVLGDLTVENGMAAKAYSRFISNTTNDAVVTGCLVNRMWMSRNTWYYISLPFNVKVGDITSNGYRAIRYYDGANRAENGTGGNWKNYTDDDIILAGTGFIVNCSSDGWWNFPSQDDESKQYMVANKMFVKALEANPSDVASNSGWNLIGNPYQAWYNIHKLNFTAPITVRNDYNYEAYSIIDDDYALAPNQAFFVQCPDGTSEISFPLDGRQLTSVIESQNGVRPQYVQPETRSLVDITLTNGSNSDRTRVVLNNNASLGYEPECDASKFMGDDNVPQIYTLDDENTQYAINERPVEDGMVKVVVATPVAGTYTLALTRNQTGNVELIDNETGAAINLSAGNYSFTAEAGIHTGRFCLKFADAATGVASIATAKAQSAEVFTVAGVRMGNNGQGLPAGAYIIKNGTKAHKVIVK